MNYSMRLGRLLCIVAVGMVLPSCAEMEMMQAKDEIKAYCSKLYSDPELDSIRHKIPIALKSTNVTAEMLSDTTRPSKEELLKIRIWARARFNCHQLQIKKALEFNQHPPVWFTEARAKNTILIADLYTGKLTYGEFARRALDIALDSDRAHAQYQRLVLEDRRVNLQEQEIALRQYQNLLNNLNQMTPQSQHQGQFPQRMNCTSQRIGTFTYTNCN